LDFEFVGLLCNVFLEDLRLGGLRVAKVHHLIQQLIYNDEVVADGFFLKRLEVFGEDLDDLVEEEEDLGGIGVAFRECEEVEVIMADIKILQLRLMKSRSMEFVLVPYVDAFVGETWWNSG
jgi:hypothetical protein